VRPVINNSDTLQLLPRTTQVRTTFRTFRVSTCLFNSSKEEFLIILCFYMHFKLKQGKLSDYFVSTCLSTQVRKIFRLFCVSTCLFNSRKLSDYFVFLCAFSTEIRKMSHSFLFVLYNSSCLGFSKVYVAFCKSLPDCYHAICHSPAT
jgi:hypothetical protein